MKLKVLKLSPNAIVPKKGSKLAAGYDLSSAEDSVVPARGKQLVKTDIAVALPEGTYGRVAPRSGLSWKKHIDIGAGVIDRDYRGNIGVVMFNHGSEDLVVKRGDRIAQLILEKYVDAEIEETTSLDDTDRGSEGFGSTGVNSEN